MSREQKGHGKGSWFQEREAARAAGGAAPEGMAPDLNDQDGTLGEDANPQEQPGQNTADRGIGQYSGQGVPAHMKK